MRSLEDRGGRLESLNPEIRCEETNLTRSREVSENKVLSSFAPSRAFLV